jgi:hypothetical protein
MREMPEENGGPPPLFASGVEHFNAMRFWEAHEAWETLWLAAESDLEQFLQGLIQLAAAYHHAKRGTLRGAVRLFDAALRRLGAFPNPYCGIDRNGAEAAARLHRVWAAARLDAGESDARLDGPEFPKLEVISDEKSIIPPHETW